MLSVRDLVVDIQGSRVLRGISLEAHAGELVCVVGRNGAGKTTILRSIMGFRAPISGAIDFEGKSLLGHKPFEIARRGIGFSPEESEVFGELSVAENVALPTWPQAGGRNRVVPIALAYKVFPALERCRTRSGQQLSGGERKMVSIARAFAAEPKLLLLDEPTEGISPAIVPSIIDGIASIRSVGRAVLIAESNMHHVPDFADRLYVIERGEVIFSGAPQEAAKNPTVARIAGAADTVPTAD